MGAKIGRKTIFAKIRQWAADTLWVKNIVEMTTSLHFRDKCAVVFNAEIQDGRQKWQETIFAKSPVDCAEMFLDNSQCIVVP